MPLIFDRFPARDKAEAFVSHVKENYQLEAKVYDSQEESDAVDPYPFRLDVPIVLVDRPPVDDLDRLDTSDKVVAAVTDFGGVWAGT